MNGLIKGSIIHIHRARTVIIDTGGVMTASELGKRVPRINVFRCCLLPILFVPLFQGHHAFMLTICQFLGKWNCCMFFAFNRLRSFSRLQWRYWKGKLFRWSW